VRVLFISGGRRKRVGPVVLSQGESLKEAGIEVDYLLAGPGPGGYLSAVPKIRRAWNRGGYDLVHAHYSLSAFAASVAGRFPLVVSLMGSDVFMSGVVRRLIAYFYRNRWSATIVKSDQMKEMLGLPGAEVIPNGVDTSLFRPLSMEEARKHISFDGSRRLVLFGSSPDRPEKNARLAEEAFALLDDPGAEFMHLSGVPHEEVPWYLNAADVVLLTSKWEGSPNVIKEAMACNCPVVSTDTGDVRSITGETEGCFITSDDASDVAAKIRQALDFNDRTTGRERIMDLGLDSHPVAVRIRTIYERVVS
jgi:glycosyltransferase involved in cell wall biosynthesis